MISLALLPCISTLVPSHVKHSANKVANLLANASIEDPLKTMDSIWEEFPPDPLKQACLSLVQDDPLPPDGVSLSSHVHVSSKKGLAPSLRPRVAASLALGTATNVPSSSQGITAFN